MVDAEAFQATLLVTTLLDRLDVLYVIGGSVASTVHGIVRTTLDVDIVASLEQEHVAPFVAALRGLFYIDEPTVNRAIERRSNFNLIHLATMVKIDVFLAGDRLFDQQQLARRLRKTINPESDETLWLLTAEDIILAKLDWFRLGGEVSERQWRDVLGIIQTQRAELDSDYLRQWSQELGVAELLEQALEQATR